MPAKKYPWRNYKRTDAKRRHYEAYPPEKYYSLLENYRSANEMGKSETLNFIIRHFFDNLPKSEIDRIRSVAQMNA